MQATASTDNSCLQDNLQANSEQDEKEVKSYGQFSASYLPQYVTVSMAVSISLSYIFAIALGQQPPIPKAYISDTAQDFPSYLFIRLGLIPIIPVIYLIYIIIYWYSGKIFEMYKIERPCTSKFLLISGFVCLFAYAITMATLCPKTILKIHTPSALVMFLLFYVNFGLILYEFYCLKKISGFKFISEKSYKIKIIYFVCQTLCILYAAYGDKIGNMDDVILMEWVGMTILILNFWTFTWDFENLKISLLSTLNNQQIVINPTIVVCIQQQDQSNVQLQKLN